MLFSATSFATTLLPVTMKQLSGQSELVFEGHVVDSYVKRSTDHGVPFTYVQFEVLDVISGSFAPPYITLGFAGGTLDGMTYRVDGIHYPRINERGIYFVETLTRELLNPLYGWHQGHYVVFQNKNSSAERVLSIEEFLRNTNPKSSKSSDGMPSLENVPSSSLSEFKSDMKNEASAQ